MNWQTLKLPRRAFLLIAGAKVANRYQSPPVRIRFYRLDFQRQDLGQRR
jgi:hypothetical protein